MMPRQLLLYRVFVASPSGLEQERAVFYKTLTEFNETEGIQSGIYFAPIGWELTLAGMGRPQQLINQEIETADFFVLLMADRYGSPTGRSSFRSGTEEELAIASKLLESGALRDIAVFFKDLPRSSLDDPGPQLRKVIDFRRKLEEEKKLLYGTFDSENALARSLRKLLQGWARQVPVADSSIQEVHPPHPPERERRQPATTEIREVGPIKPPKNEPPIIFICYARSDNDGSDPSRRWLDRVLDHLAPLGLDDQASLWSDKEVDAGDDWHARIQDAIELAKVALLLVSPAFLKSEYIRSSELPVLLRNAKDRGLVVIPVILRPCMIKEVTFRYPDATKGPERLSLATFQSINDPKDALNGLQENGQDLVLVSLARRVLKHVRGLTEA
jgi:TIR domain-containing protein/uncharacterized protein DUF4062